MSARGRMRPRALMHLLFFLGISVIVGQTVFHKFRLGKEHKDKERYVALAQHRERDVLDIIVTIHLYNVILVLTAAVVTGIWGLVLYFTKHTMNRPWRISLIVTAILGAVQGVLGVTMVALGAKPGTGTDLYYLHYVYGAIVAFAIPVALTYTTSGKNPRRDMLIFSIAALILAAAGVRAWMTGPVH